MQIYIKKQNIFYYWMYIAVEYIKNVCLFLSAFDAFLPVVISTSCDTVWTDTYL